MHRPSHHLRPVCTEGIGDFDRNSKAHKHAHKQNNYHMSRQDKERRFI